MAFIIHNCVTQIMSTNEDKSKNERDLGLGYSLVWSIYLLIGIFGSLAL